MWLGAPAQLSHWDMMTVFGVLVGLDGVVNDFRLAGFGVDGLGCVPNGHDFLLSKCWQMRALGILFAYSS